MIQRKCVFLVVILAGMATLGFVVPSSQAQTLQLSESFVAAGGSSAPMATRVGGDVYPPRLFPSSVRAMSSGAKALSTELHHDGTQENGYRLVGSTDVRFVELFTPASLPATYTNVRVSWAQLGGDTTIDYNIVFYANDGGGGAPGTFLGSVPAPTATGVPGAIPGASYDVDVSGLGLTVTSGSVYIGVQWDDTVDSTFFTMADESGGTTLQTGYMWTGAAWATIQSGFAGYRAMFTEATSTNTPVFTSTPPTTAAVGQVYTYNITTLDPVGGGVTITAPVKPPWLTLTDNGNGTATLTGNPSQGDAIFTGVELQVEDTLTNTDTQAYTLNYFAFNNPVANPSFETGDFTAWTPTDIAGPFSPLAVVGAGFTTGFGFFSTAPTDGVFVAHHGFDGTGPGTIVLAQTVTVPALATTMEFDYRVGWDMFNFGGSTLPRIFEVNIHTGGPPLQTTTILTAPPGTVNLDTGPQTGVVDVSAFAGQTVTISFDTIVPESFTGPGMFQMDNVRFPNAINLPLASRWALLLTVLILAACGAVMFRRIKLQQR